MCFYVCNVCLCVNVWNVCMCAYVWNVFVCVICVSMFEICVCVSVFEVMIFWWRIPREWSRALRRKRATVSFSRSTRLDPSLNPLRRVRWRRRLDGDAWSLIAVERQRTRSLRTSLSVSEQDRYFSFHPSLSPCLSVCLCSVSVCLSAVWLGNSVSDFYLWLGIMDCMCREFSCVYAKVRELLRSPVYIIMMMHLLGATICWPCINW